jgi:peptide-methionine (S)-S-oxide reductase
MKFSHVAIVGALAVALAASWHSLTHAQQAGAPAPTTGLKTAVFAGGCFWCMEKPFDVLPGVTATVSGYTGGRTANPTYEDVSAGNTGHAEAVQITYDPAKVSYAQLLEVFWRNIDPFDARGQFCDRGSQYRSAVFVANDGERSAFEASKRAFEKRFGKAIATTSENAAPFYAAEDYHQDYYSKNPLRYRYYRGGCGRDNRLAAVWGKEAGGANVLGAKASGTK